MAGVLARILVAAGETVAVGTTLAVLESADISVASPAATERWARQPKLDRAGRPLSPSVRRLLGEHGLDPAQIPCGGRHGRIRRSDVLARVQSVAPIPNRRELDGERLVPFNRMRKRTAEHMLRSKATSPHVLQAVEVDFSAVLAVREKYKADWLARHGVALTFLPAPIINQPQVAILSLDGVHKRATVIESEAGDSIAIRPIGVLAQSFDHRAVDGAYSAAYLRTLKGVIEARGWEAIVNS